MTRKRARDNSGRFIGDDKTTPDVNEAYEQTLVDKIKAFLWIPHDKSIGRHLIDFVKWMFK